MLSIDEEHKKYLKDSRMPCKYGVKCYQKNSSHHEKYKHPTKKRTSPEMDLSGAEEVPPKKTKVNIEADKLEEGESAGKISNDLSDSEEELKQLNIRKISNDISDSEESTTEKASMNDRDTTESLSSSSSVVAPKISKHEDPNEKLDATTTELVARTPKVFDKRAFIKEKFLMDMPEDFYQFWDFCKLLNNNDPSNALSCVDLILVGPYDVLADKFSNVTEKSPEEYLTHWRYYYDPPEFQTVIRGSEATEHHIGYFRDTPSELPVFVGSNCSKKDGEISCKGENIFAAINLFLEEAKATCNPFKKMTISKLQTSVKAKAESLKLNLSKSTPKLQQRSKKILARTFNKAGLVVPYNRKTQLGYRHLCVSDKELKVLLDRVRNASDEKRIKVMSELQPVLTATSIATDECDFGTGIELGWNILAHGVDHLNSTVEHFLTTAYQLLQREEFVKIIGAHMKNRRKGVCLSIL